MQRTRVEHEHSQPGGPKPILLAENQVHVIVVRFRAGGGERALLHERVVSGVVVHGGAQKPLRFRRLRPIETSSAQIIAKRNLYVVGHTDGVHGAPVNIYEALCGKLSERIKLRLAGRTVGDAGIFVNCFERRKEPDFPFNNRAANSSDVVLTGERLLGVWGRGLDWQTRVQRGSAFVESQVSVPVIRSVFGCDYYGSGGSAAGVGVHLGSAKSKLLDGVTRKILQEAPNVIVGIVSAIDG